MKRVIVRIFGQVLHGRETKRSTDEQGQEWVRVLLDHDTVIGGVGPARDYVEVVPGCVEYVPSIDQEGE